MNEILNRIRKDLEIELNDIKDRIEDLKSNNNLNDVKEVIREQENDYKKIVKILNILEKKEVK